MIYQNLLGIGLQRFSDFSNFLQSGQPYFSIQHFLNFIVLNDENAQKRSLPVESMFALQFDDGFNNW